MKECIGVLNECIRIWVESINIWERASSEMTSGKNPKFEMRLDEVFKENHPPQLAKMIS